MDDYSALAYRIAGGVADVRGCLILSRDGLILGSYPDDETAVKPAWVRFASLGDPERSFVEFGDQVWVYVRRPAYGAFAVANAGIRPGLVIDQLEGILTSAEESRNRRDTLRVPEASGGPRGQAAVVDPPVGERELHADAPGSRQRGGAPLVAHDATRRRRCAPPTRSRRSWRRWRAASAGRGMRPRQMAPPPIRRRRPTRMPATTRRRRSRPTERMRRATPIRRRPTPRRHVRRGFRHTQRQGCGRARSDGARRRRRGGSGHVGQRVFGAASG